MTNIAIRQAEGEAELARARSLFVEYATSLDFSLCFQGFDAELAGLPGKYAPPSGALLLAWVNGKAMGVVALRALGDLGDGIAEMKRLYVQPEARGLQLGRKLAEAIIAAARDRGYRRLRIDTLQRMQAANALYDALGFYEIPPYTPNPEPDVRYREVAL